jgi:peptide/nickel transport system permease protein
MISPRPLTGVPIATLGRGRIAARRARAIVMQPRVFAGLAILLVMTLASLLAPWLATHDPRALSVADRLLPPSSSHLFGTDQLGRDVYSRILFGGRASLLVGSLSALLSCLCGTVVGLASAASKFSDAIIMRIMDGLMSIPPILLAIALIGVRGGSIGTVIAAVVLVETPRVARLVRSVALSLREQPYVEAAVAAGSHLSQIVIRHILPSLVSPLAIQFAFVWAAAMLIEAALSFIGAGLPPSTPSWGNIMSEAKALWQVKPALIFIPAAFLSTTVLGVNLLGEGLRQALDPRGER